MPISKLDQVLIKIKLLCNIFSKVTMEKFFCHSRASDSNNPKFELIPDFTLKAPIMAAAEDIHKYFFIVF